MFWLALFIAPSLWILISISTVLTLRFMWLVLVLVALTLNMINVVGYVKCRRDAGRKLSAIGGTVLTRGLEVWSSARGAVARGSQRVPTE